MFKRRSALGESPIKDRKTVGGTEGGCQEEGRAGKREGERGGRGKKVEGERVQRGSLNSVNSGADTGFWKKGGGLGRGRGGGGR